MLQSKQNRYDIKSADIKEILPRDTGVYLFRDKSDKVLYVGKAKNIRNRVSSYLKPAAELTGKTEMIMNRARYLEFMITDTENEAFILEGSLIKKHRPRYNVILRDDKQYPYLRINIGEPYPRLEFVRKMKNDKAIYFGPYSSSGSVRSTMKLIERIFRLRKCTKKSMNSRTRPCLNYQLDRCLAPCTYDVSVDKYKKIVEKVRLFLEGRSRELIKKLEADMKELSLEEKFEEAARVRDQIRAVERTVEKQNVVSTKREDQDIIGAAQGENGTQVVIFFSRKGIITGNRDFRFENKNVSSSEVMEAFLKQYYYKAEYIPGNILISQPVDDLPSIRKWLSDKAGKKISIHLPVRGKKVSLVNLAVKNAESLLLKKLEAGKENLLNSAKKALHLKKIPGKIEAMDISNLHGNNAVGTIVSFLDGRPHKAGYRNYRIKNVEGIDDYEMMAEMVSRRLTKKELPDLFVIDGGKGHLKVVERVINDHRIKEPPELIALAKERDQGLKGDKIYLKGRKNPLRLNMDNPVLLFLMGIRDEVHRRAVTYHRKLRDKESSKSLLDDIPGIGPSKKKLLLKNFGHLDAVRKASEDELAGIRGISKALAASIKEFLKVRR